MNDYRTMPNPALQPAKKAKPAPIPQPRMAQRPVQSGVRQQQLPRRKKQKKLSLWLLMIPIGLFGMLLLALIAGIIVLNMSFANQILPRVQVAGIPLGGMTPAEAQRALAQEWSTIILTDGTSTWNVTSDSLGINLNAQASAQVAFEQGHGTGGWSAMIRTVNLAPVITVDTTTMSNRLTELTSTIEQAPVNAGVAFVDGQVVATQSRNGTMIDIQGTISALTSDYSLLNDGTLDLQMLSVTAQITDSSGLVTQAEALLTSPLDIRVFDPVTGDSVYWSVLPNEWAQWLTATSDPNSPIGLSLSADSNLVRSFLQSQADTQLDSSRYLDVTSATASIQSALEAGTPQSATVYVQHRERTHIVQSGESITSIGWDYGIPYLYIIEANNGIDTVSVGQEIIIPPADYFIEGNVNPDKRIVVSISAQRTYVYENGELIYEWASSTGINSSPTWTGVYQIISHEPNAYAGNWNLYMPYFMGVYQPVPNSEFTNGFHGFPTRGGGQLLWANSLGTRVTYGCILLSDTNVQILYNWAENGVIVEIQP